MYEYIVLYLILLCCFFHLCIKKYSLIFLHFQHFLMVKLFRQKSKQNTIEGKAFCFLRIIKQSSLFFSIVKSKVLS